MFTNKTLNFKVHTGRFDDSGNRKPTLICKNAMAYN